jgi:hypothetical protein
MLAESRRKSMLQYVSEGANKADLDAAGYTPAEVAAAFPLAKPVITSQEFDRDRQGGTPQQGTLEAYTPTYRENFRENVRRGASALGAGNQTAQLISDKVAGSATNGELGILDMTGLGIIPGIQEGVQQAQRGSKTGDKTEVAMGALNVGLNVLGAIPGGKVIAKGVSKGTKKLAEMSMDAYDPAMLRTIGTPSDQTTAALGVVPKPKKQVSPKEVIIPTFKAPEPIDPNAPDTAFGLKQIHDVFSEDKWDAFIPAPVQPGEVDWALELDADLLEGYNSNVLGYSRNIRMNDLANIKLGRDTPENVLEQYGNDATPETLSYLDSRLKGMEDNPEFIDYTKRLENSPDYNFDKAVNKYLDSDEAGVRPEIIFRSPIPEFLDVIDFPKKGMEGSQLLSALRSNPTIRKSELDSVLPDIDPKARYTREEAKNLLEDNLWDVRVNERRDFESYQRQDDLRDPEIDYKEFTVNARRPMSSTFAANKKHYSPDTLAHTRMSFRENVANGGEYALVEELQTDLLQGGYKASQAGSERFTPGDAVENLRESLIDDYKLDDFESNLLAVRAGQQGEWKYDYGQQTKDLRRAVRSLPEYKNAGNIEVDSYVRELIQTGTPFENLLADSLKISPDDFVLNPVSENMNKYYDLKDKLNDIYYEEIQPQLVYESKEAISQPPIKTNKEAVRLLVGTLIAKSAQKGVGTVVFPPIERIVEKRFYRDSGDYAKALTPGSGFYQTYVTDLQSVLKDLQKELGADKFVIGSKDLDYSVNDRINRNTGDLLSQLPVTGIEIDFSSLIDAGFDLSKMRFAEGGLVGYAQGGTVEDEQMNRLMQDGGMADAGVAQEPVTGNEVPPGALPSEVRDDVPVQLSEGEYVVPADVLRFFGVRFFEDLRNQAKQGMAEMQSNGRIGGASVDSNGVPTEDDDDELTPEEEQMLQAAMGSQEAPTGMAEGGVVPFDRSKFTLGDTSGRESRKYIDPTTGVTQVFQFLMGSPVTAIPSNFVPWTQELETAAAAKPTTPTITTPPVAPARSDRESTMAAPAGAAPADGEGFGYTNWAEENYDAIQKNPYQFGIDALTDKKGVNRGKVAGVAGLITGLAPVAVAGLGLSASARIQNIAEANAALEVMKAKGLTETPDYANLQKLTTAAIKDLPGLQQLFVENHLAGSGKKYGSSLDAVGKMRTGVKAPTTPTGAAPAVSAATRQRVNSSGVEKLTPVTDRDRQGTPALVQRPTQAPVKTTITPTAQQEKAKKKETAKVTSTLEKTKSGLKVGGFKDGGLITRPTKK